jgi:hypothetical protein
MRFALIRPVALLAHFVAQTPAVFKRHIAPTRRTFIAANFTLLLPVVAHLLAHLTPFIRRQIAPVSLRPNATGRTEEAQQQQQKGKEAFHG